MSSRLIVLAGVAGSGKTTVGRMLARGLGWDFADADDYHSAENKARMAAGEALTDEDRDAWLGTLAGVIRGAIADRKRTALACSALSRAHRDMLRVDVGVELFLIHVPEEEIVRRLRNRTGHFFNPVLIRSQFEALEPPSGDERATVIDGNRPPEQIVEDIRSCIGP
jgi:gluconokinase